jgi:hypothetical protein
MAEEGFARRNLDLTMRHLEAALDSNYTMTTLLVAVQMLSSAGLHSVAHEFAHEAAQHRPTNPLRAAAWSKQIEAVDAAIQVAARE